MVFDPNRPHKNIDGNPINLTEKEISDSIALARLYEIQRLEEELRDKRPKKFTRLVELLFDKGVIELEESTDLKGD